MTSIRIGCAAVLAAAFAVASHVPAYADFNDKNPINYSVDGATATGYLKVVTEAINGIVRDAYPGTAATYKPGSPAGGILNISTGQSDFTFNGGSPEIRHALEGKAPFTESLKGKFSYVLMLHNDLVVHSIMTKEWADKNGIKSFDDIAAKKPPMRLAVNLVANLQSTLSMYVALFDVYGIKEADVTSRGGSLFRGNSNNGLEAMRDGKIDVFINGGFIPTAQLTDLARGRQLAWISASPEKIKAAAAMWAYDPITLPKSAYPFLTQDELTITQWAAVVAGNHVKDETVYKFMKALFENKETVRAIHPSMAAFETKTVMRNPTPVPYHPGAAKYYREAGLLK
jgi:uncharacterized protein